ncbi:hypothetical protein FQZ97_755950 [compost metagenome]
MALQAERDQEPGQHRHGRRQEDGRITEAARYIARDRAGDAQRQVQEGGIRAQRSAAAARGHARHGFHADRREHQGEAAAGQCRPQQGRARVGRQPQQQQAGRLHQEGHLRHAEAAETRDGAREQQAHADEGATEGAQRVGRPVPGRAGVVQGHERRQRAEAHGAQAQRHTVRKHPQHHALERHAVPAHDGDRRPRHRQPQAGQPQQQHGAAERAHAPFLFQVHAQRRAQRQAAVGADAVPRNHARGVQRADAGDGPRRRARAHPALAEAQRQPAGDDRGQAEPGAALKGVGQQQEHPAGRTGRHADHHGLLRAHRVRHAARVGAAEQGGGVLHADRQAGQHRPVTELVMDVAGQHGQRQADGQIADKGEKGDGNDAERQRERADLRAVGRGMRCAGHGGTEKMPGRSGTRVYPDDSARRLANR